jgi:hypothetical protein
MRQDTDLGKTYLDRVRTSPDSVFTSPFDRVKAGLPAIPEEPQAEAPTPAPEPAKKPKTAEDIEPGRPSGQDIDFGASLVEFARGAKRGTYGLAAGINSLIEAGGGMAKIGAEAAGTDNLAGGVLDQIGTMLERLGKENRTFWNALAKEEMLKSPDIWQGEFLDNPSFERVMGNIGAASPSLGAAIVTTIGTGNPLAGAALLGATEGAGTYSEAVDAEQSREKALGLAAAATALNIALEKYGLDELMKVGGGGLVTRALTGAVKEGGTEGLQQMSQNAIAKLGFDEARSVWDGMGDAIVGGLGSGGAVGGFQGARTDDGRPNPKLYGQTVTGASVTEGLNEAKRQGLITQETFDHGMKLAKANPSLAAETILEVARVVKPVTDEVLKAEGFSTTADETMAAHGLQGGGIITGTAQYAEDVGKTIIKLFEGHDHKTVIEEWFHAYHKRLQVFDAKANEELYGAYEQSGSQLDYDEWFASQGVEWWTAKRPVDGALLKAYEAAKKGLMILAGKADRLPGAKIDPIVKAHLRAATGGKTAGAITGQGGDSGPSAAIKVGDLVREMDGELSPDDSIFLDEAIPKTGESVAFKFQRRPSGSTKGLTGEQRARYGADVEPSGRYLTAASPSTWNRPAEGLESGVIEFANPLVIPWGGGYQEESNWKRVLSKNFGGLKGKALSEALRAAGHDGIIVTEVTRGVEHTGEIIDLRPREEQRSAYRPATAEDVARMEEKDAGPKTSPSASILALNAINDAKPDARQNAFAVSVDDTATHVRLTQKGAVAPPDTVRDRIANLSPAEWKAVATHAGPIMVNGDFSTATLSGALPALMDATLDRFARDFPGSRFDKVFSVEVVPSVPLDDAVLAEMQEKYGDLLSLRTQDPATFDKLEAAGFSPTLTIATGKGADASQALRYVAAKGLTPADVLEVTKGKGLTWQQTGLSSTEILKLRALGFLGPDKTVFPFRSSPDGGTIGPHVAAAMRLGNLDRAVVVGNPASAAANKPSAAIRPITGMEKVNLFSSLDKVVENYPEWISDAVSKVDIAGKEKYVRDQGILNLNRLDLSPEEKALLAKLPQPSEAEDIIQLYRSRGLTVEEEAVKPENVMSLAEVLDLQPHFKVNTSVVYWVRSYMAEAVHQLRIAADDAANAKSGQEKEQHLDRLGQLFALTVALKARAAGATAESGRTLWSFVLPAKGISDREMRAIDHLHKLYSARRGAAGYVTPDQIINMIGMMENDSEVAEFIDNADAPGFSDMIYELWINGLLSGSKTHVVNTVGTGVFAGWMILERQIAGVAASITGRNQGSVDFREAAIMSRAMATGFREAIVAAGKIARSGKSVDTKGQEIVREPAITAENLANRVNQVLGTNAQASSPLFAWANLVGEMIRLPTTRGLAAEDGFWKALLGRAEYHALAWRMALDVEKDEKKANGFIDAKTGKMMPPRSAEKIYHTVLASQSQELLEEAQKFALTATFQKQLGAGGNITSALVHSMPGARYVLPFIKTPTNIIKEVVHRNPVLAGASMLLPQSELRADLDAGGARRELAIAKISLGTAVCVAVAGLVASGVVSGGPPEDRKLRRTLERQGWLPYAVRVGDKWYGYNRLDPVGAVVGMVADFCATLNSVNDYGYRKTTEDLTAKVPAAIVLSLTQNITSKTFLTGIADFIEAVTDRTGNAFERWGQRFAGSWVPNWWAQSARFGDPMQREAETFLDQMKSRSWWFRSELSPRVDIWGRDVEADPQGWLSAFTPYYTADITDNPVDREISRVLLNDGRINGLSEDAFDRALGEDLPPQVARDYQQQSGKKAYAILEALFAKDAEGMKKAMGIPVGAARKVINLYHADAELPADAKLAKAGHAQNIHARIIDAMLRAAKTEAKRSIIASYPEVAHSKALKVYRDMETLQGGGEEYLKRLRESGIDIDKTLDKLHGILQED